MRLVIWAIIWLMSYGQLFGQLTSSPNFDAIRETRLDPNELDTFVVSLNKIPELRDDIKILYSDESHLAYTIVTSWQSALELSGSSQTKFIDMYRAPKEESVLDDPNFAFNRIRKAQSLYPELAGNGLVVCIKERRFDIDDIDLLGKSIELKLGADSESQHATDMATIISGMGNTSPFNLGVVPAATISTSDFNNLLPDDPTLLQSNGVFTQNHSYGVGIENYYGVEAAAYDQLANDYPTLIHVFSVGNAGTQTMTVAVRALATNKLGRANARRVMVFRFERPEVAQALGITQPATPRGVPVVYELNFNDAASVFAATNMEVMPEDVIYVPLAGAAEMRKFFEVVQSLTRVVYDVSVTSTLNND